MRFDGGGACIMVIVVVCVLGLAHEGGCFVVLLYVCSDDGATASCVWRQARLGEMMVIIPSNEHVCMK